MKKTLIEEGVYTIELESRDEQIYWGASFVRGDDAVEIRIPDGATAIAEKGFMYCNSLKRLYMPRSITYLGDSVFYGVYQPFEIFYEGSSEEFLELSRSRRVKKMVQVPGKYDVQPYNCTEGTYYEEREETVSFDQFCAECYVVCSDGVRLRFGYKS